MNDIFVIDNNTFHEGNNDNCFNYVNAYVTNKQNNIHNNKVIVTILVHLPTRNIINYIIDNKQFETIITTKKKINNKFMYKRGLYIDSNKFKEYQTNPNNRQLEKEIKNKIKSSFIVPQRRDDFKNYLNKLSPQDTIFDYNKLLKKEYLYYYYLTKFIIHSNNDTTNFNNNSFLSFIANEKFKNNNLEINTIEEYVLKISDLDNELTKKYSFIKVTENFILMPDYKCLITPNDLFYIFNKENNSFADFINLKLEIIYKYKYNINNIIDAGEKINAGIITKNEWLELLDEVSNGVHDYFTNIFGINQVLKNDIELIPGIIMSKNNINIWTNLHPVIKFFHFSAEFVDDGVSKTDLKWEFYSRINLTDVIEYSKMNILSKFIFNYVAKMRDVEFFNCFDDCNGWNYSQEKTPDVTQEMYDTYIQNKHGGSKNYTINVDYVNNNKNKDKFNLKNISRNNIIDIIKNINWNGSIKIDDCKIKIYGNDSKYVLYIIPHIIQNNETEDYLKNITKLFEDFYISRIDYVLYLHEINDNYNQTDKIIKFDALNQNKDTVYEYLVKITSNKCFRNLINDTTTQKFKKQMLEETGEEFISHMIYEWKSLSIYKNTDLCSFPEELVNKKNKKLNHIFEYTRFLLIRDKENKACLINSIQAFDLKNSIAKSPYITNNIKYCCMVGFFISPDNKIKFNHKINIDELDDHEKFEILIKSFFENIYSKKNHLILIGYPMPWRKDNTRIFNIFSLLDSDYDYLKELIYTSKKEIIKFINNLKIYDNQQIINIDKNNIEIYAHYPNDNGDLHFHFYIYKTPYRNYYNRKISYDFSRSWNINEVLNLLEMKVNFFKNAEFVAIFNFKKYYMPLLNMYNKNKHNYTEICYQQGGSSLKTAMTGSGDNKNKFIEWTNKYLNYEQIFKIYSLPVIWIEFDIQETTKQIQKEDLINKYYQCFDVQSYDIVNKNFYKKLYDIYQGINKHKYKIDFLEKILFKKLSDVMFITEKNTKYDNFSDELKKQNYDAKYDSAFYDLIQISSNFNSFNIDEICKTFMHSKKKHHGINLGHQTFKKKWNNLFAY